MSRDDPETWRLATVGDDGRHRGVVAPLPVEDWRFRITGRAGRVAEWTLEQLRRRPPVSLQSPIHCVSSGPGVYQGPPPVFTGVSLASLLAEAQPTHPAGTAVLLSRAPAAIGAASRRHETPLPTGLAMAPEQVLLAWALNEEPLAYANGGPLRAIVDGRGFDGRLRYFYKSLKWIEEVELIAEPLSECRRGTWERGAGYGVQGAIGESKIEPFLAVARTDAFPDWIEPTRWRDVMAQWLDAGDLSRLVSGQLHRCLPDFWRLPGWNSRLRFQDRQSAAQLRAVRWPVAPARDAPWNLSRVNLSLARLDRACLGHREPALAADLSSSDCEGASFRDADLRHVNFRDAYLASADLRGARWEGADFRGAVLDRIQLSPGANLPLGPT